MRQFLSAALISLALLGGSRSSAIEEGSWVMSMGSVREPPVIAVLRQTSENQMTIAFTFWNGHRFLIPLHVSYSPDKPGEAILSGSVPFIQERKQAFGDDVRDVRLLAFQGFFPEDGRGTGKIVVMAQYKVGQSETEFAMNSLKQLNIEAAKAEQGGAGEPATRSESEGGDKPRPEAEGRPR